VKTPSQTVGPYYTIGLVRDRGDQSRLADDGIPLVGTLFDGQGEPISDGLIEAWDAAGGRWGRSGTDADGRFALRVPADASHVEVYVTSGRASTSTTRATTRCSVPSIPRAAGR